MKDSEQKWFYKMIETQFGEDDIEVVIEDDRLVIQHSNSGEWNKLDETGKEKYLEDVFKRSYPTVGAPDIKIIVQLLIEGDLIGFKEKGSEVIPHTSFRK